MGAARFLLSSVLLLVVPLAPAARAEEPTKDLLDLKNLDVTQRLTPQPRCEDQISAAVSQDPAAPGLVVTIKPGKGGYPGYHFKPPDGKVWDLSAFGHVEARVVNTGAQLLGFDVRLDNAGDWHNSPWNYEPIWLNPGAKGTVTVIFGHANGHQPGYALKPEAITSIVLYTENSSAAKSFRVESLVAGGPAGEKPPLDPNLVRSQPKNGAILGPDAAFDVAVEVGRDTMPWNAVRSGTPLPDVAPKIEAKGGAQGSMDGQVAKIAFSAGKGEQTVAFKPPTGRWDLRDATEVRVKLKNEGPAPIISSVQVTSNGGPTDATTAPLAPGEEKEIVASFIPAVPGRGVPVPRPGYYGCQPGTGTSFTSDTVTGVTITAKHDGEARLLVESITAAAPVAVLPEWLGKRPPVEGDWVKTFDENFDGPAIDQTKWDIYGPNFWDQATHWTKDNLILDGGMAKLHYEKKRGFHNDNPDPKVDGYRQSDYACGFLETYGKWVQRYGYFEARLKLPRVPGLWPVFWMVPDRGAAAGPMWARQSNVKAGMEMDIMEHLTRWGPYHYNIALHWDGYQKDHKSVGGVVYTPADKDGFITPGLLWTPGSIVMYCNGQERWRWDDPRVSDVQAQFIIEMTLGGWDNNSIVDKKLPADFVLDYVRVWQRKDLASSVDGVQTAP